MSPRAINKYQLWRNGKPCPTPSCLSIPVTTRASSVEHSKALDSLRTFLTQSDRASIYPLARSLSGSLAPEASLDISHTSKESAAQSSPGNIEEAVVPWYDEKTDSVQLAEHLGFRVLSDDAELLEKWYEDSKLKIRLRGQYPSPSRAPEGWKHKSSHGFTTYYDVGRHLYQVSVYLQPRPFICKQRAKAWREGIDESQSLCLGKAKGTEEFAMRHAIMWNWEKRMVLRREIKQASSNKFLDHWGELMELLEKTQMLLRKYS
jgi:hypothetical protein